jgi:predicted O-methyltransferase YrrM
MTPAANASQSDLRHALHDFIDRTYAPEDEVLRDLLATAVSEGLPAINVSPSLGKFLGLLVQIIGAKRVLEVGTLAGYSAIWMGRALPPDGSLLTLELEPRHAAIAQQFIERAGLDDRIEVRVGPALASLEQLAGDGQFDMAFIDADKAGYPAYLDHALRLVRPGGLIAADNVLRDGAVLEQVPSDEGVTGIQRYNERVALDPRLDGIILVTRSGGHHVDGVSVARVR